MEKILGYLDSCWVEIKYALLLPGVGVVLGGYLMVFGLYGVYVSASFIPFYVISLLGSNWLGNSIARLIDR